MGSDNNFQEIFSMVGGGGGEPDSSWEYKQIVLKVNKINALDGQLLSITFETFSGAFWLLHTHAYTNTPIYTYM